ncbi:ADP-ribose pyrophosphatase [Saezia sanguinis]|uniref:GDP-mannose pyrophosphatase n=1 Tax=Saezia sanguinis TaxID=1965230 RepID=A0A433SH94_9BURK|nr:NUDIX hydrolase [Saezia sanguinis]RUS68034.1 ADP-ribose pyrophosphatase [Saezia sanguinis]
MSLKEKTIDSQVAYRGGFLEIRRDAVLLPDGKQATREYCVHPGAAVVIPVLPDGQLVLEKQYRYPVQQEMIEFPAGKLDPQESDLSCAVRELREETGYTARRWAYAGKIYPCIGYSDEIIHIWLATELSAGAQRLDQGEFVDVFTAPVQQVNQWSLDGTITDSKTLCALRWLNAWLHDEWQPDWQVV